MTDSSIQVPSPDSLYARLPLEEQDAIAPREAGQKAARLSDVMRLGLPTPGGGVLRRAAWELFVDANGLRQPIAEILSAIDPRSPGSWRTASEAVANRVGAADIPPAISDALERLLRETGPAEFLAVRSSAIGEDSEEAAFAGQLDSVLHVPPRRDALEDAVRRCWASYWSARVLFYQHSRGVRLQGMAVLIQPQIRARMSGILFTRPPQAGGTEEERMWVEYCEGLGEQLAAGKITPRCAALPREGDVPAPASEADGLSATLQRRLRDYGLSLERHFGSPQDIEWTVDQDDRLVLLQTRPITTRSTIPEPVVQAAASASAGPKVLWSNVNVNENYPDPVCPLLYSIAVRAYYHYFRNLGEAFGVSRRRIERMEPALRQIIGAQGGRIYYNLSHIHDVLRTAPFGDSLVEFFHVFVGHDSRDDTAARRPAEPAAGPLARLGQTLEVITIAARTWWSLSGLPRSVKRFEDRVDAFAAQSRAAVDSVDPDWMRRRDLLQQLRRFLEIRFHGWLEASLADAAAMFSYGLWRRFVRRHVADDQQEGLHNSLLKGLREVVSSEPAVRLWELSRRIRENEDLRGVLAATSNEEFADRLRDDPRWSDFRRDWDDYLETWGFRCSRELMLTAPSLQEQPAALVAMLRTYVQQAERSPGSLLQQQQRERVAATQDLRARLRGRRFSWWLPWPTPAWVAGRLLAWTQQAIACRERARLKQALLYSWLRRICLGLGDLAVAEGRLRDREDLLFLTWEEIESFFSGGALSLHEHRELAVRRREETAAWARVRPPEMLVLAEGESWKPPPAGSAVAEPAAGEHAWAGQGVCGGRARGRAAVLDDLTEAHHLQAGDILVTRQTDPGWGPVFLLISGLVMERGGMLSHGAILAREYGLPTVVGLRDATRRIRSGQMLLVDGDRGRVEVE